MAANFPQGARTTPPTQETQQPGDLRQGFTVDALQEGNRVLWEAHSPTHKLSKVFSSSADATAWATTTAAAITDGTYPRLVFENDADGSTIPLSWVLDQVDPDMRHIPLKVFDRSLLRERDLYATNTAVYALDYNVGRRVEEDLRLVTSNAGFVLAVELANDLRNAHQQACATAGIDIHFNLYLTNLSEEAQETVFDAVAVTGAYIDATDEAWATLRKYESAVSQSSELQDLTPEQQATLDKYLDELQVFVQSALDRAASQERTARQLHAAAKIALTNAATGIAQTAREKANNEALERIGRLVATVRQHHAPGEAHEH